MKVTDLIWSDLCLWPNNVFYKPTSDSNVSKRFPEEYVAEIVEIKTALIKKYQELERTSFSIKWNGIRLRVECYLDADDEPAFTCRRPTVSASSIQDLGVPPAVAELLLSKDLKTGLVIFFGEIGSGKTTTQAAYVKERMVRHGGTCVTVENPVEIELQGSHGDFGQCLQLEAYSDTDMENKIEQLHRSSGKIFMFGEIRTGKAINAVLAFASVGLVVITFHASDIKTGFDRMVALAGLETREDRFCENLSTVLKAAIHLTLYNEAGEMPAAALVAKPEGTGRPPRILSVEPIFLLKQFEDGESLKGLQQTIAKGQFGALSSSLDRQRRRLMAKGRG